MVSDSSNGDEVIEIVTDCVIDCLMGLHACVVVNKIASVSGSVMEIEIVIEIVTPIVTAMVYIASDENVGWFADCLIDEGIEIGIDEQGSAIVEQAIVEQEIENKSDDDDGEVIVIASMNEIEIANIYESYIRDGEVSVILTNLASANGSDDEDCGYESVI